MSTPSLNLRDHFNPELIECNANSHRHKPNHVTHYCQDCHDDTIHMKIINADGSMIGYSCEPCWLLETEPYEERP